jgi:type II secretory pathway component PulF
VPTFVAAWRLLGADRHRAELYRMWRVATAAGFTVPTAMEAMGERRSPEAEALRQWLLNGTRGGKGVGTLARTGGRRLGEFERALLVLGDESGTLEQSLDLLADHHSARNRLMLRAMKRMAYPLFTGICATFIAPFPLLYLGHRAAYVATVAAGLLGWAIAGGTIVLAAAHRFGREPALVRARLARALATAIEAGMSLPRALRLAAEASDDAEVRRYVNALDERALTERPIDETLARCPHMSPDFLAVLGTAQRTGDFRTTMTRLADLYEDGFR